MIFDQNRFSSKLKISVCTTVCAVGARRVTIPAALVILSPIHTGEAPINRPIDSHVHFWNPDAIDYPWLSSAPAISQPTFPADLDAARGELSHDLAGIVFVGADCAAEQALREAEWVTFLAAQDTRIRGIVAHARLQRGEAVRDELAARQALPLVKSIRRLIRQSSR